jgi:hypothetical protein
MERQVSAKQMEANQQNAQRSTGPKTVEGKSTVRWNALKHGLLARAAVIPRGGENEEDFERLLAGLVESLQPVGVLEGLLVEDIASIYWRRRRAIRAEKGEIEHQLAETSKERESEQAETLEKAKAERDMSTLNDSAAGLQMLIEVVDNVATEIRNDGKLSEESVEWLEAGWEWSDEDLDLTDDERKGELLEFLDETRKEFRLGKKAAESREAGEREMEQARLGMPDDSASKTRLRYEVAMDRKLHAAIAQLERLQKHRHNEIVPAPSRGNGTKAW